MIAFFRRRQTEIKISAKISAKKIKAFRVLTKRTFNAPPFPMLQKRQAVTGKPSAEQNR